jgi:hypothetical protein
LRRVDAIVQFPEIADVLARDIIGRLPFFPLSSFLNTQREDSPRKGLFQLGQSPLPQLCNTPRSIRHKMVQGLWIALPRRFGDRRQRLAFEFRKHSDMQLLEVFKTAHVREQILRELTLFIDKGHRWGGRSRLGHSFHPSSQLYPYTFLSLLVYSRSDRRGLLISA